MIQKLIHTLLNKTLDFLMPQKCVGCEKPGNILCEKCLNSLPLSVIVQRREPAIIGATRYETSLVKNSIRLLKYKGIKIIAGPLGKLLYDRTQSRLKDVSKDKTLVIPIPVSKQRLKERGYNQAALIAGAFSAASGFPVAPKILVKKFHTASQVEMASRSARLKNLKGSFEIKNPAEISGKTILLIDDVITTGATFTEASRTLKKAGAEKIICLAVAAD